jgi:hypothetical protein
VPVAIAVSELQPSEMIMMANHVYDVGPDSTLVRVEMAGWLIYGTPVLLVTLLLEVCRTVWVSSMRYHPHHPRSALSQRRDSAVSAYTSAEG